MARRVVVTGLGIISPVGNTLQDAWGHIVKGQSGIDTVDDWKNTLWAGEPLGVTIGGVVKNFDPEAYIEPKKDIRRMDRVLQFAIAAGRQAWEHAGLPAKLDDEHGNRAGAIVGVGLIGINSLLDAYEVLKARGPKRVTPFLIPSIISNLAPAYLAIRYNLKNANWTCVSACASGTHGIGEAFMHIQSGRADLMMAGGAESAMHPIAVAGFDAMHALCRSKNADPKGASRPFDKERDGFVMGEGAGMVVLEELESAKKRGANILAEVVGYGSTNDAYHITAPAQNGEGAQRAIRDAMKMAAVNPEQVGYINAHGTSTQFNDKSETEAIKAVFGAHARSLMVSSTKSMTGHLLGAAGGVEGIFSVLAMTQKLIPPTINYEHPDPECDLDYVPNTAREAKVDYAMSNSFGFGGTNAVLLFKRFE
jgi:3-oxoacyl-[acyl-carrier-protein] synthase II